MAELNGLAGYFKADFLNWFGMVRNFVPDSLSSFWMKIAGNYFVKLILATI